MYQFQRSLEIAMPKISVIVPVYNVESYLPQCIDSIRRQTFGDIEIVCVVDGSTDRSESILRLYEKVEPRMKIVVKPNGGLSSARNAGIEASSAPILMFVDSDDMLTPDACEVVCAAFESCDTEVVTFGARCYPAFDATAWLNEVLSPRDAYYSSFDTAILFEEKSRPFVWRTAVSAELLKRTGLHFDESVLFGEDQIFHFEVYPEAQGVTFLSNKLYDYRPMRPDSLMATRSADKHRKYCEHIVIVDRICAAWKRKGLLDAHASELLDWIADFLLYDCMTTTDETCIAMCEGLKELLPRWFTRSDLEGMECGMSAPRFFRRIFEDNLPEEELNSFREDYRRAVGYVEDDSGRPVWKDKLRTVLPMSALGLEERLDAGLMTDEKLRWLAFEAGACSRSLEMLRCELMAKGLA